MVVVLVGSRSRCQVGAVYHEETSQLSGLGGVIQVGLDGSKFTCGSADYGSGIDLPLEA